MDLYDSFGKPREEVSEKGDGTEKRFIDRNMFVPMDIRDSSLHVKRRTRVDMAVTVVMLLIGASIFLFFMTFKGFKEITGFSFIAVVCIYLIFFSTLIYFVASKFVFRIDEKMRARSLEGSEIFDINLGMVWRIRAGGINSRMLTSGECALLNYDGRPAIIFKRINDSVEGNGEDADAIHYKAIQQANDILINNTAHVTKLNLRFDTDNDNIWDYESKRLYNSNHGDEYVAVMQEMLNHRYEFTSRFSTVTSNYYILVFKPNTTLDDINSVYETVKKYIQFSCSSVSLVGIEEFQSILTQYYGLSSIDLNNMMPTHLGKDSIGNSRVLDFVDREGNIIIDNLPELKVSDVSIYTSLYPEHLVSVKDGNEYEDENGLEDLNIFSQEYV